MPLPDPLISQVKGIEQLSQYAWRFRYPGAPYVPDAQEAEAARQTAARLLEATAVYLQSQFDNAT
jgi:hypothetical protein